MAAIVVSSPTPAYCQRLEDLSRPVLLKLGLDGVGLEPTTAEEALGLTAGEIARQALELALNGYVTLKVQGTTDTNTADSDAVNLSDVGVTFADATFRRIEVFARCADNDGMGCVFAAAVVDGGTTPIVTDAQDATGGTDTTAVSALSITGGLAGAPLIDIEVVSNEVIVEAVGISSVDVRWDIDVRVYPAVSLAYFAG